MRSSQVEQEEKTKPGQAVDCIWTVKATPKAKVLLCIELLQRTELDIICIMCYFGSYRYLFRSTDITSL